jgi:hypothetical protein
MTSQKEEVMGKKALFRWLPGGKRTARGRLHRINHSIPKLRGDLPYAAWRREILSDLHVRRERSEE